jgi:hypothetical protein
MGFRRDGVYRIWPQSYENLKTEIFSYTVDIGTDVLRRELLSLLVYRSCVVEMDGGHIWHVMEERHVQWLTYGTRTPCVCVCVTVNLLSYKLRKI